MNNNEIIRAKRNQQNRYQNSIYNKRRLYDINRRKIERLKRVKDKLKIQKGYANERYRKIKAYGEDLTSFSNWTGNKANATKKNIRNIAALYNSYVKSIDFYLDSLCNEITRIENENMRLNGDILYLGRLVNSIANEIEKFFN